MAPQAVRTPTPSRVSAYMVRQVERRNLGHDPNAVSSSSTALFPAAAASDGASSTVYPLFPTQSQGQSNRGGGPNVYYLVFLGILVVLMVIAGCFALKGVRARRRYRTATQLALARGDPLPAGATYWGLGGMGWNGDAIEREERRRRDRKKVPVPVMYENEVVKLDDEAGWKEDDEMWESLQPVSVQSLRPKEVVAPPVVEDSSPSRTRPSPFAAFRQRSFLGPTYPVTLSEPTETPQAPQVAEADRSLVSGEAVRVSVMIQMPHPPEPSKDRRERSEWDDEEVGWEEGMELGVWEGNVAVPGQNNGAEYRKRVSVTSEGESAE
ncbi:hypothetical protein IAU60_005792 [Kwoniella sp. DSM 27419]